MNLKEITKKAKVEISRKIDEEVEKFSDQIFESLKKKALESALNGENLVGEYFGYSQETSDEFERKLAKKINYEMSEFGVDNVSVSSVSSNDGFSGKRLFIFVRLTW